MGTEATAIKIKQMRRYILHNLNMLYPSGMALDWLYRTVCGLDEAYDRTLFVKDICYLKEKGYIRFVDDAIGGMDRVWDKVAVLTVDGKDIADKTNTDKTLEI